MATINSNSDSVYIDASESLELYDKKIINGRKEQFLYALCALDYEDLPVPLSRIELWLNGLITGDVPTIEPQSRNEYFLKAILTGDTTNLPVPQSRVEILLNKLANGETDLSDCEPIQSRYEFLLSYLVKNGGIGVEFVTHEIVKAFETLYNTKERPFKQAILKGNTFLNVLSEPSLKNTMTNVESQKLNQGYDAVNAVDGEFKSAILSGQTLVNLKTNSTIKKKNISSLTESNGTMTWDTNSAWGKIGFVVQGKANTKYCIMFSDKLETVNIYVRFTDNIDGGNVMSPTQIKPTFRTFTTNNTGVFICSLEQATPTKGNWIKDFMIIEYQQGMENWDIPYFEGMQSVKMPVLTTTGKNLFNFNTISLVGNSGTIVDGGINITYSSPFETFINRENPLKLKKGDYALSFENTTISGDGIMIKVFANDVAIKQIKTNTIFSLDEDSEVYFSIVRAGNSGTSRIEKIQLEHGIKNTSYEPYKSNILTVNEEVELRGIGEGSNRVEDELDCLTGEVVEYIDEIMFDGSSDEKWVRHTQYADSIVFRLTLTKLYNSQYCTCDRIMGVSGTTAFQNGIEQIKVGSSATSTIYVNILNSKLSSIDVVGFKTWLQSNPINIQLVLATPVIKTVDLTVVDQYNQPQTAIYSFNDGHINLQSLGLLPTVDYTVPTNNSYYIQDTMKLNTQYTSKGSSSCNATIDGKVINLDSDATFTTPSTITNKLMVLDTPVNDLMFIEGNQVGKEIPYFTGMKSVVMQNQMPILTTMGESIINKMIKNQFVNKSTGVIYNTTGYARTNDILIEKEKEYFIKFNDKDFDNAFINIIEYGDTYLRGITFYSGSVYKPSSDCNYIRVSTSRFTKESLTDEILEKFQLIITDKTSILSCNEEVELGSVGEAKDKLNLLTGQLIQRTETRAYRDGDEANSEVVTDMINTRYKLPKESIKTVNLTTVDQYGQPTKLKSFNDVTYVKINSENIIPTVELEVATKIEETISTMGLQHHDISETQDQLSKNIDEQTENTDATMMATTEIYEQTL